MNRLQKRAWIDLVGMIVCVIPAVVVIRWMIRLDVKGISHMITFLSVSICSSHLEAEPDCLLMLSR